MRSLLIVKPDICKGKTGMVLSMLIDNGFKIVFTKIMQLDFKVASEFYKEHFGKPFYGQLIDFMCSDQIVVVVVEKLNCAEELRKLVGSTNPEEAAEGTIRKKFGTGLPKNAVHASDSGISSMKEIDFFFSKEEQLKW